jgi:N-acetylglucosamine-6-sulfatase
VLVLAAGSPSTGFVLDQASGATAVQHPNIVFVLTDDLTWNLVKYMPNVRAMRREGETFTRYFVTDSLCCPSRASIFTGRFPHNTGIFTNSPPDGGFDAFHSSGQESDTFATSIHAIRGAHYETAMMGKYLNGYEPSTLYTPPGWTEWDVAGDAYPEYDYDLDQNGRLVSYGSAPGDYLTDVLADRGVRFIRHATNANHPFLLEVSTFAPHTPATPAPRDLHDLRGLIAPRTPAFNFANLNPPTWLAGRSELDANAIARLDYHFRKRATSVEAVDDLIGRIEKTLASRGVADKTYLVFSSDNGYHMGDHRLREGKLTAFDTDIRVPLIVVGPGVPAGNTVQKIAANIDLRPTFSRLTGARVPRSVDGRSLVPLLRGKSVDNWRGATLVEHHGRDTNPSDPDFQPPPSANPPSYEALRRPRSVYVEYDNGDREYYNLTTDPFELDNTYADLGASAQAQLHQELTALENCSGSSCR